MNPFLTLFFFLGIVTIRRPESLPAKRSISTSINTSTNARRSIARAKMMRTRQAPQRNTSTRNTRNIRSGLIPVTMRVKKERRDCV